MGNLNFTYSSSTKALETPSFFYLGALEKKDVAEKKRLNSYTYAFNSMERDDEWNGVGNSYSTMFRQYDPRIGKWLSIDPEFKEFVSLSPYQGYGNSPIWLIDRNGDVIETTQEVWYRMNNALTKIFGENHGFSFDPKTGFVSHESSGTEFKGGQKELYNRFLYVVNHNDVTVVQFKKQKEMMTGKRQMYGLTTTGGKRVFITENPTVSIQQELPIDPKNLNAPKFEREEFPAKEGTMEIAFLHEIAGHVYFTWFNRENKKGYTVKEDHDDAERIDLITRRLYKTGGEYTEKQAKKLNKKIEKEKLKWPSNVPRPSDGKPRVNTDPVIKH